VCVPTKGEIQVMARKDIPQDIPLESEGDEEA
jgi:hypothetical protein